MAVLRASLAARKTAARAALERHRSKMGHARNPHRRRRWWLIPLALLLLLLLLKDCRCEEPPEVQPPEVAILPPGSQGDPVVPIPSPARVPRRDRPSYVAEDPGPLPWVDALRLQVAARSPRLAVCFVGAPRPGALKWTADVEPGLGRVSGQVLEPVLSTEPLGREQRDCAFAVLSEPVYRLEGSGDERSTPVRVSLVVEF